METLNRMKSSNSIKGSMKKSKMFNKRTKMSMKMKNLMLLFPKTRRFQIYSMIRRESKLSKKKM